MPNQTESNLQGWGGGRSNQVKPSQTSQTQSNHKDDHACEKAANDRGTLRFAAFYLDEGLLWMQINVAAISHGRK
jgi:hypothetical protein